MNWFKANILKRLKAKEPAKKRDTVARKAYSRVLI